MVCKCECGVFMAEMAASRRGECVVAVCAVCVRGGRRERQAEAGRCRKECVKSDPGQSCRGQRGCRKEEMCSAVQVAVWNPTAIQPNKHPPKS